MAAVVAVRRTATGGGSKRGAPEEGGDSCSTRFDSDGNLHRKPVFADASTLLRPPSTAYQGPRRGGVHGNMHTLVHATTSTNTAGGTHAHTRPSRGPRAYPSPPPPEYKDTAPREGGNVGDLGKHPLVLDENQVTCSRRTAPNSHRTGGQRGDAAH